MVNVARLDAVMEVVEAAAERGEHDQIEWARKSACGTTHCFAGWAAVSAGAKFVGFEVDGGEDCDEVACDIEIDGETTYVAAWAREYLDLDPGEANELFYHSPRLDDVRETVAMIKRSAESLKVNSL